MNTAIKRRTFAGSTTVRVAFSTTPTIGIGNFHVSLGSHLNCFVVEFTTNSVLGLEDVGIDSRGVKSIAINRVGTFRAVNRLRHSSVCAKRGEVGTLGFYCSQAARAALARAVGRAHHLGEALCLFRMAKDTHNEGTANTQKCFAVI